MQAFEPVIEVLKEGDRRAVFVFILPDTVGRPGTGAAEKGFYSRFTLIVL